jgi:hypothetical protein
MFKAIGWLIKLTIFTGIILVLGNMLHWKGHTVSDQVKTSLASAQTAETIDDIKTWANHITSTPGSSHAITHLKNAKKRALPQESPRNSIHHANVTANVATDPQAAMQQPEAQAQEEIPSSERQKLRALIREINTSRND